MQKQKTLRRITGPNTIQQLEHIDLSDAKRVVFGGYVLESALGSLATAKLVGAAQHVLVTNETGGTLYVATDNDGTITPSASNGIPVLNGSQMVIGTGENKYIKASGAVTGVLLAK